MPETEFPYDYKRVHRVVDGVAVAYTVSSDIPPETLAALDELARCAIKYIEERESAHPTDTDHED